MTSTEFSVKRYKQALSASQTLTDEFSHWFKWKKAAEDDPSIDADNNKVTPSLSYQTFRIALTTCNIKQENDPMISVSAFGSDNNTNDSVTPISASSSETSSNQLAGDLLKSMLSFSSPPSLINANLISGFILLRFYDRNRKSNY